MASSRVGFAVSETRLEVNDADCSEQKVEPGSTSLFKDITGCINTAAAGPRGGKGRRAATVFLSQRRIWCERILNLHLFPCLHNDSHASELSHASLLSRPSAGGRHGEGDQNKRERPVGGRM